MTGGYDQNMSRSSTGLVAGLPHNPSGVVASVVEVALEVVRILL